MTRISCPSCGHEMTTDCPTYVHAGLASRLAEELIRDSAGTLECVECGNVWDAWIPLLYDDPEHELMIYVADADRETLGDEYHAFLEAQRGLITPEAYRRASEESYQVVAGLAALRAIARAALDDVYLYHSVVGFEAPEFDAHLLIAVANAYQEAGEPRRAFEVARRAAALPTADASIFRELGAHAFAAGEADAAEEALVRSLELKRKFRHLPAQRTPRQGVVSKAPDGVHLQVFQDAQATLVRAERPELALTDEQKAELAGAMVGELERALVELPRPDPELTAIRFLTSRKFDTWVARESRSAAAEALRAIYERVRSSSHVDLDLTGPPARLLRMGEIFAGTDKAGLAELALRKVRRRGDPEEQAQAALRLGDLLVDRDAQEAENCFAEAALSSSANLVALSLLRRGQLKRGQGKRSEAHRYLAAAAAVGETFASASALFALAGMHREDGDTAAEERCLGPLVAGDYGDLSASAAMRLGAILLDRGDYALAEYFFTRADSTMDFEMRVTSWYQVGLLRAARGDAEGAWFLMEQVAALPMGEVAEAASQWLAEHAP